MAKPKFSKENSFLTGEDYFINILLFIINYFFSFRFSEDFMFDTL